MKKNSTMRVAALLLALVIITTCFVGSTLAKYTSETSGSANVSVAKWELTINGDDFTDDVADTWEFNLFETINDTVDATKDETDVDDGLIAPGTTGSFELAVVNLSEVNARYTLELSETTDGTTAGNTSNIPLQYSVDGQIWTDDFSAINGAWANVDIAMNDNAANGDDEKTQTVYWRWAFEGPTVEDTATTDAHAGQTDETDTALGVAAQTTAPSITVFVKLTATQVD